MLGISNNITSLKKEADNILFFKAQLENVIMNIIIFIYIDKYIYIYIYI